MCVHLYGQETCEACGMGIETGAALRLRNIIKGMEAMNLNESEQKLVDEIKQALDSGMFDDK